MINGKTTSLGNVLWKVMRSPLALDLTYDQAAEFALEFIGLMGAPLLYSDSISKIEINNFKGRIPDNMVNVRGVRYLGCDGCSQGIAMRYATDTFHGSSDESFSEFTYTLQSCVITTSFKKGFVEMSYKSINVDKDGYPLIPDDDSFKMGLEYYILDRYIEPLWMMGKIQDKVFNYIKQERHWYLAQAETIFKLQGIDHLESMMNGLNRILINTQAHDNFYKNFGEKERIKKYN